MIQGLRNAKGQWCTMNQGLEEEEIKYFGSIFTSAQPTRIEAVTNLMEKRVTQAMNEELLKEVHPDEVKQAFFQMFPLKALGPDGMNALFFQKFWHIVGTDVTKAVLSALSDGQILKTLISLI